MNRHPPPSEPSRWAWKGLRNRYRPDHRISRGMVTVAPWVDTVLLLGFFMLCSLPFVLQPGIAIDLPATHVGEGHPFGHTMVVVLQHAANGASAEEIVFFDDRRFRMTAQRDALREALRRAAGRRPDLPLNIEADRNLRHGLLIDIYTLAAEAGITDINLATRPY